MSDSFFNLRWTVVAALLVWAGATAGPVGAADGPATAPRPVKPPVNLLANGDFEKPDANGTLPAGWTTDHPKNVRLVDSGDPKHGKVVQMTGDKQLMGSYGTDLLSDRIAFKANTLYRLTGWIRSDGPNFIIFVKGYATVKRRVKGQVKVFDDVVYQMKKQPRRSKNWSRFSLDFEVLPADVFSDFQHEVKYLRIKLWAYWPAGVCWYDDVRFEEVGPIDPARRRHDRAMTHEGVKPRLGPAADGPDAGSFDSSGPDTDHAPAAEPFDEKQVWVDAANAFRDGQFQKAWQWSGQLIAHNPDQPTYRLLAARAAVRCGQFKPAQEHLDWIEARAVAKNHPGKDNKPIIPLWLRDMARLVQAEICHQNKQSERAMKLVRGVLSSSDSVHVRHAAEKLLKQWQENDP